MPKLPRDIVAQGLVSLPGREAATSIRKKPMYQRQLTPKSISRKHRRVLRFPSPSSMCSPATPLGGNPLAVVHAAEELSEAAMAALARWTNLSETTFLLPPTDPDADYRVRIFTPASELPFAGHPTLGSCHAWLAAGGKPRNADMRGAAMRHRPRARYAATRSRLAFAAPPLRRTGPLEADVLEKIVEALSLSRSDIVHHQWVDNGPGWCAVMLRSARQVLSLKPSWASLAPLKLGVVGPHDGRPRRSFRSPGLRRRRWIRRSGHGQSQRECRPMAHRRRTCEAVLCRVAGHCAPARGTHSCAKGRRPESGSAETSWK